MENKRALLESAIKLFAQQGFEGTSTLQIAKEAGVTEPLIYYHFEGKDDLFVKCLETAFNLYFSQLNSLPKESPSEFDKIVSLFDLHFQIVDDLPDIVRLVVNTCPAKLNDPNGICRKAYQEIRNVLLGYIHRCLTVGIRSGEFSEISIPGTTHMLIALITGLLRQWVYQLADVDTEGVRVATIEFCRKSLCCQVIKDDHRD